MINNRQAGRRRGRGNNGTGQQRQGNPGRPDNGNRIDNRARGNAAQLLEKYKSMASDAQRQGDRVATEYYLQFADHYFRVLSEQRGRFEDQQPRGQDEFDADDEFGNEGEPYRGNEQGDGQRFEAREERPREDRQRDERPREDRQRDDRPRNDRPREDRPREDRPRDERPRDDRPREDQPRSDRAAPRREWQDRDQARERRPADEPVEVAGQRRADPIAASEPLAERAEDVLQADRPLDAPARRRGRPRRDAAAEVTSEAVGFEADRLPPSLMAPLTLAANDEAPEAKPRRRRVRAADETPTAAD